MFLLLLIWCASAYEWTSTLHDENGYVSTTFPPGDTTSWELSATQPVLVDIFVDGDSSQRVSEQLVAAGSLRCPKHCVMSISATVPGETVITVQITDESHRLKRMSDEHKAMLSQLSIQYVEIMTIAIIALAFSIAIIVGLSCMLFACVLTNKHESTSRLEDSSTPMEV